MTTYLITEALQQVKILTGRIEKKRQFINKYLTRNSRMVDPLASEGGSKRAIKDEMDAINKLEEQIIAIRVAIQKSNLDTTIKIESDSRTVAEWLVWRRDVASPLVEHYRQMDALVQVSREKHLKEVNQTLANPAGDAAVKAAQLEVNINEVELSDRGEILSIILGTLDAKLSVLNATTSVTFNV
jgi:hypothetical protein